MKPKVPKSLKNGHENLVSELNIIIANDGKVGEKAKALETVMSSHFQKEEEYALPPLGLLLSLSEGNWELDSDEAIEMSEMLKSELSELKKEHDNISKALHNLKIAADEENHTLANRFIKDLMLHVEIEDQVLYPATILIGNYLRKMKHGT